MLDWLETFRIVGSILIWIILPLQVWSTWRSWRQFKQWEAGEKARVERWTADMVAAAQMREEAFQLRERARRLLPANDQIDQNLDQEPTK